MRGASPSPARGEAVNGRNVAAAAFFTASGALVACSAIIGTRDLTLTGGTDGGTDAGPQGNDAATDTQPTSTCNANLTNDSLNCGKCGHDCLGGACTDSQCQPVAFVQGQAGPTSMGIDDGNVYWVNYGGDQIVKASKDGKKVTVISKAPFVSDAFGVTVDDANVYWANYEPSVDTPRILRCAKDGCASATPVVSNLAGPIDVAVDDTNLYWVEDYDPYAVGRVDKFDGGGGTLARTGNFTHGIAIDDTSIYFSVEGFIGKIAKSAPASAFGSTFKELYAASPMYAYGIAVDATNVYWAVYDGPGQVFTLPKGGGAAPTAIATGLSWPLSVALDATNIYWVNVGPNAGTDQSPIFVEGTVMMCPKSGCPTGGPITLATKQAWVQEIAVDDVAIYWTARGNSSLDGAIVKIAK